MDLTPFSYINPCGYQGLRVTQTKDLGITDDIEVLSNQLAQKLQEKLFKG
jgi:lipoyl(octanoyl) transferase